LDEDAKFLSSYKKRVDVVEEATFDVNSGNIPEVYAELAEDVDLGNEMLHAETELDWDVVRKLRDSHIYTVKIKLYPVVGTVVAESSVLDKNGKVQIAVEEEQIDVNLAKILEREQRRKRRC